MVESQTGTGGQWVSRAAHKLNAALDQFKIDPHGRTAADFGSNVGGFVQVLLARGAKKVYAVEKGYGVLDWQLRKNPGVVVLERTDARHVALPEPVDLIVVDAGWTRLNQLIPALLRNLTVTGQAILLLKTHYEAEPEERDGGHVLVPTIPTIIRRVTTQLSEAGLIVQQQLESPIRGAKGENPEWLLLVSR